MGFQYYKDVASHVLTKIYIISIYRKHYILFKMCNIQKWTEDSSIVGVIKQKKQRISFP